MEDHENATFTHRFGHAFFHERRGNCLGHRMGMHGPKLSHQLQQWRLLRIRILLLLNELLPIRLSLLSDRVLPPWLSLVLSGK
jgi:hypothetical protein